MNPNNFLTDEQRELRRRAQLDKVAQQLNKSAGHAANARRYAAHRPGAPTFDVVGHLTKDTAPDEPGIVDLLFPNERFVKSILEKQQQHQGQGTKTKAGKFISDVQKAVADKLASEDWYKNLTGR
ncbi:MAG: hypothetical protein KDJ52_01330 [Anaerolineae bacterium]|nr:hypothetical protein [Anaerolineae bacterium]